MYNDKHNEENGEQNLDGSSWNFSNNYGVEGPTRKRYINALRKLNWRNAVLMLMLAQGFLCCGAVMRWEIPRTEIIMHTVRIIPPAG